MTDSDEYLQLPFHTFKFNIIMQGTLLHMKPIIFIHIAVVCINYAIYRYTFFSFFLEKKIFRAEFAEVDTIRFFLIKMSVLLKYKAKLLNVMSGHFSL